MKLLFFWEYINQGHFNFIPNLIRVWRTMTLAPFLIAVLLFRINYFFLNDSDYPGWPFAIWPPN
jgi:hypothetical protein